MDVRKVETQTEEDPTPEDLYPNCDMTIWLRSCEREVLDPVSGIVTGTIPKWVNGDLLRNGPGRISIDDSKFRHLFDCPALLHRFCIKDGTVTYQNRYLRSSTYVKNLSAKRIVVTEFGTKSVPDPCQTIFQRIASVFERVKTQTDNAMVSIYPFGDEYFALGEYPFVHRINPMDLSTEERVDFKKLLGIMNHTSHPHILKDGTIYNLGTTLGKTGPRYCILEFPKTEGRCSFEKARIVGSIPARWKFHPAYMHTFGITDNFFVVVEQPLSVSVPLILANTLLNRPLAESLKWYPDAKTIIYLISKKSGLVVHTFDAESFFYLHIINQYEEGNHVVLDVCCYRNPSMLSCMYIEALKDGHKNPDYASMFRGRPLRFVLPTKAKKSDGNLNRLGSTKSQAFRQECGRIFVTPELLCNLGCETPRINYDKYSGKKYKYFYAISSDVDLDNPGTLIKVDVVAKTKKTWCEKDIFPSEPIFVPRPGSKEEDDGVVLSALIWGGKRVNQVGLLVLDAKTWKEVGRAVFVTDGPVPKCLHGWFVGEKTVMKPNLVAIRPSELVILAIHSLGGKSGSSEKKITRFISRKYGLSEHRLARKIRDVLAKGLDFGILTCRNGRYDLEDVPEPPSKHPVGQGVPNYPRCYKRTVGNASKRKRVNSDLDRKFSELIEQQIQQWKKDKGVDDDYNTNMGKPMDLEEEDSAECINATANNTPKFTTPDGRVQSTSGSKYRRVRLVSPKSCRKPGNKMIMKRSLKSGKGKKPGNKGASKTRARPVKTQTTPARYGLRYKQRPAGKRKPKSRSESKTTAPKVSARSKPKTCHKICPKGCPKSIQRSKQARAKEAPSQRVNCNPSSTDKNNNNNNNNNNNSNYNNFSKNDNTNNNSNSSSKNKSTENTNDKNKPQSKTGQDHSCEKM